eukprot:scaffold13.g396.t1
MEFVSPEGLRLDGRRPRELRALKCEFGVLASADGSATFEMGNTKVLAAVFGPKEAELRSQADATAAIVKQQERLPARAGLTRERRRRGKSDRRATELSLVIRNTLEQTIMRELMPRSQIDVYVQVLQADGGTRCACINAAFLALADAGVPMRDVVASCAAGYLEGTALLDLNYLEDSGGGPDVVVALQPNLDKVVLLQSDNRVAVETFEEVVSLASQGCRAVAAHMRGALLARVQRMGAPQQLAPAGRDAEMVDGDD